jgi:anti-sigma regulatory factor (Ser/Thr protein kinase)
VTFVARAGGSVESITLVPDPRSIGAARRFVQSQLDAQEIEASVAVLLTSELVTNVVQHARTPLTLVVRVESSVRVEVHDGVAATRAFREILARPPTNVPATSPGGRGLGLVSSLATRFGLDDEPGDGQGKIVWFELDPADLA